MQFSPKDLLVRTRHWNDPTELAMLENLGRTQGGRLWEGRKVPNNDSNSITLIATHVFDTAWTNIGWDVSKPNPQGADA